MIPCANAFCAPLWQHAQQRPQDVALWSRQRQYSWAQLAQAVEEQASLWRQRGLQVGDRVLLRAADEPQHLVAALGVLAAGGIHMPLDHRLSHPQFAAAQASLAPRWLLEVDATGAQQWRQCAGAGDPLAAAEGQGATAFIRHTSGTTGSAKGVVLSHAAVAGRADAAIAALDLRPGDAMLWVLPLAYHFAVSVGACVRAGCAIVFAASLRAAHTAAIAREALVTHAYLSPWHASRLADPQVGDLGPRLRQVLVTTAAVDALQADALRRHLGVPVRQALGVIEVGLPLVSNGSVGERAGALGQPAPGYAVRILDPLGQPLPPGETGELAIVGPGLFDAYLDPWQRADAVLRQGYFCSGDAARLHRDGAVELLGRLKSVINIAGVKVFPLQVEAVLQGHPAVRHCRVRGVADDQGGEVVQAEVEAMPDYAEKVDLAQQLSAHCRQHLSPLECPSRWHFGPLPLTPSGKVRR